MPILRGRRDDVGGTKHQMREKMFSIGDDALVLAVTVCIGR